MEHRPISINASSPNGRVLRLLAAIGGVRALILLIGTAIFGYGIYQYIQLQEISSESPPEFRMPVTNSPLEPDRPDLLGEPRIDE